MLTDLLHALASNTWAWFLVVLFFGGSIFVHELGHFLAARWRGARVERFSIGFGPKIFSWYRNGVEYRVSWIPLGGYVLLPQLADLGALEGKSTADVAKLPPISYTSKVIIFLAGAVFNILFAFALACVVWLHGQPTSSEEVTTRIGYVSQTVDDGTKAPSPASLAGLRIGDTIFAIDGQKVTSWSDLTQTLIMSSGRGSNGQPQNVFTILRNGQTLTVTLHPRLSGDEQIRRVGISPAYDLIVLTAPENSPGQRIGLKPKDQILSLDTTPVLNLSAWQDYLATHASQNIAIKILRDKAELTLTLPPRTEAKNPADLGLDFTTSSRLTHPNPVTQVADNIMMTFRTLWSLLNPHSDIGLSKLSSVVGIVHIFHSAAEAGLLAVAMFTILINVNLAIVNLLPVPVLDGGQIVFATIAKLRGRALPINIVAATQGVFLVLLLSMILYVNIFDVRRWVRDAREEKAAATTAAQTGK
ncbi:MAG TPA: RIP metalloprotease RseP [Opitutaceae bacterium]|jgi:regulator of sigma E protease|nr:RIP metalloprotease RseP [Opitutaceae bacterium]